MCHGDRAQVKYSRAPEQDSTDSSIHPRALHRLDALLLDPSQDWMYSLMVVPSSAPWAGSALTLALYLLLKMASSNLIPFSHTLHTGLGYIIFFFKFFCSAEHNFKIRNCFSADSCGSAFHFLSRWVVMKSVLLISFSEASSPKSKEVNYRTVSEKKMQIPRLTGFPSKKT